MSRRQLQTLLLQTSNLASDGSNVTDAELLARFTQSQEPAAFTALVRRHGPMVWSVCRNLMSRDADAEDVFQATFLALIRDGSKIRTGEQLGSWLHGVAFRIAMKARRSAANRKQREAKAAVAEANLPVAEQSWNELLAAVHEEVNRLPASQREVFVLCCLEGLRQTDAAQQLGLKPNTLTTRLARARQQLIDRLTKRGITLGAATCAVGLGAATSTATIPGSLLEKVLATPGSLDSVSPTILQLSQGALEMTLRTKLIAATLLVAASMTTTIGTMVFSNATGQAPRPSATQPAPGGPFGPGAGAAPRALGGPGAGADDALAGPGAGMGATAPARAPSGPRWEYKTVRIRLSNTSAEAELNKLGEEGWELVSAPTDAPAGERGGVTPPLVFKRYVNAMAARFPRSGGASGGLGGGGLSGLGGMPGMAGGDGGGGEGGSAAGTPKVTTPAPAPAPAKERQTKILPLKHARASSLQEIIGNLLNAESTDRGGSPFGGRAASRVYVGTNVKIAADERTNSLIVIADEASVKTIEALVEQLDVDVPEKEKPKK